MGYSPETAFETYKAPKAQDCLSAGEAHSSASRQTMYHFLENLLPSPAAPLITDGRRIGLSRFDAGLDLQSLCYRLVVVPATFSRLTIPNPSFHIRFDLQSSGHRLVVLE